MLPSAPGQLCTGVQAVHCTTSKGLSFTLWANLHENVQVAQRCWVPQISCGRAESPFLGKRIPVHAKGRVYACTLSGLFSSLLPLPTPSPDVSLTWRPPKEQGEKEDSEGEEERKLCLLPLTPYALILRPFPPQGIQPPRPFLNLLPPAGRRPNLLHPSDPR